MRKKIFPVVLTFALLCAALPLTASAEGLEATHNMEVLYEVEAPVPPSADPPEADDPPPREYVVEIPASINLNYEAQTDFFIFARWSDIREGEKLVVSIDGKRTSPSGEFYLNCWDYPDPVPSIKCAIYRGWRGNVEAGIEEIFGPDDAEVAVFGPSTISDSTAPIEAYGRLKFEPCYDAKTPPGLYGGLVYFKIAIIED